AAATIKDKTGVDGFFGSEKGYYLEPFLLGEGTDTVDAEAKKITVNSAKGQKAAETWLSLFNGKGLHKADVTADSYAHRQDAFVNGKVAMTIEGPWEITNFYKGTAFKDKNNLGVATVPAGSTGKAAAPTGGHNLSVYAGSDKAHQDAALQFVKWMTSAKAQEQIALKNSTLPTRSDAYTEKVTADPGLAGFQKVLSAAQPRPELPEYSSLWGPLDQELPKAASGKESLDAVLSSVEVQYGKLLPDGFSK
ncbi:extracellular solute-binding protein, partial [Streptomyces sp. SID6013]|nr:extracellular solute-binding protein [Streptomyces sp. SID6013]